MAGSASPCGGHTCSPLLNDSTGPRNHELAYDCLHCPNRAVDAMERHLDNVEGELLEIKFHQNMPNWVRHYLKRPARVFVDDIPGLEDAIADGVITEADVERADERAKLLARLGLRARPFVAGIGSLRRPNR